MEPVMDKFPYKFKKRNAKSIIPLDGLAKLAKGESTSSFPNSRRDLLNLGVNWNHATFVQQAPQVQRLTAYLLHCKPATIVKSLITNRTILNVILEDFRGKNEEPIDCNDDDEWIKTDKPPMLNDDTLSRSRSAAFVTTKPATIVKSLIPNGSIDITIKLANLKLHKKSLAGLTLRKESWRCAHPRKRIIKPFLVQQQQPYGAPPQGQKYGAPPQGQGMGYDPQQQEQQGGNTPIQQGFDQQGGQPMGYDPQQQKYGTAPQGQGMGYDPQQQEQQGGNTPIQQGFDQQGGQPMGYDPQQQKYGTAPQGQGMGYDPQQQQYGAPPQGMGYDPQPQQQQYGMGPQGDQGMKYDLQQQAYGAPESLESSVSNNKSQEFTYSMLVPTKMYKDCALNDEISDIFFNKGEELRGVMTDDCKAVCLKLYVASHCVQEVSERDTIQID
eukprot:820119_1